MIKEYLGMHKAGALVFVAFSVVYAVIFGLYGLPVAAVGYASAICLFMGAILLVLDYGRFCEKHKKLNYLKNEITVTLEHLPDPKSLIEQDYQELTNLLFEDRQALAQTKEEQYRELVEYYSIWVHQIKTPIAAMKLILQGSEVTEYKELMEELLRIEQYVEMVLCYLRLDSDSTDYVIKEYDLDRILRQVIRRYAASFIRKRIKLTYEPVEIRVVSDEKWLFFVVDQIMSNALKYTASGSITISLEEPKTLCITDTGIGIAKEDLSRIFEKGYTGSCGRDDKRASGIGLYLCSRICRNLGHGIAVSSEPGRGTRVRLDLKNAELEVE